MNPPIATPNPRSHPWIATLVVLLVAWGFGFTEIGGIFALLLLAICHFLIGQGLLWIPILGVAVGLLLLVTRGIGRDARWLLVKGLAWGALHAGLFVGAIVLGNSTAGWCSTRVAERLATLVRDARERSGHWPSEAEFARIREDLSWSPRSIELWKENKIFVGRSNSLFIQGFELDPITMQWEWVKAF